MKMGVSCNFSLTVIQSIEWCPVDPPIAQPSDTSPILVVAGNGDGADSLGFVRRHGGTRMGACWDLGHRVPSGNLT